MRELMYGYFPRIHTALAEWMVCVAFVLPVCDLRTITRNIAASLVLLLTLLLTFFTMERMQAQGVLWLVMMMFASLQMLVMLRISGLPKWRNALYYWAYCFMYAEFAASLEWQINCYLIMYGIVNDMRETYVVMMLVYAAVFAFIYSRRCCWKNIKPPYVSKREAVSALGIALGAFTISNIQFAFKDSVFSETLGAGVLYARTMVDLGGVIMLYVNSEQRREMLLRYELDAMNNLFKRQYEQYELFVANNEAMHRVYHDLKHQIAYLESETSREKRIESLAEMKEIIQTHESWVNTGNRVLDVLLTNKGLLCVKEGILMTCYADAKPLDFMDIMDVCSIFGNIIDNAIEYECTVQNPDDRLIKIHVGTRGAFLLIRIQNYCETPIVFDGDTPATTKADKQLHGYGLRSVRQSCEKYGGHLSLEQADGWFTVTVLIPLPKTE